MKFDLDEILDGSINREEPNPNFSFWTGEPGGTIKRHYVEEGTKYVEVEFENSPGVIYTYLEKEDK